MYTYSGVARFLVDVFQVAVFNALADFLEHDLAHIVGEVLGFYHLATHDGNLGFDDSSAKCHHSVPIFR